MDAELKTRWIEALRGGEWAQAVGVLHDERNNSYCCLGVLACLVNEDRTEKGGYVIADDQIGNLESDRLQELNDGSNGKRRHTFPEIADYIEKNL